MCRDFPCCALPARMSGAGLSRKAWPQCPRSNSPSHHIENGCRSVDPVSVLPGTELHGAYSVRDHHAPVLGIEAQGAAGGRRAPFCKSSIEIRAGERTKVMWRSRGGRLIVTLIAARCAQVAWMSSTSKARWPKLRALP